MKNYLLAIHNVETLCGLSHTLAIEVVNLTLDIFHLTSYISNVSCFIAKVE